MNNIIKNTNQYDLTPQSFEQLTSFAEIVSKSEMVPKDYVGKPGNIIVAVQMGAELGLKPLQSIQNISIINGRPSLWGDALIALIKNHPICESIKETFSEDDNTAFCEVRRKGEEPQKRSFSISEATTAGLINKDNWKKYPKRMIQLRARAWALRDVFPDILCGMQVAEEQQDKEYETIHNLNKDDVIATLKPLGLSVLEKDGMFIVSGNTYQRSDILKQLGFKYENKHWQMAAPNDLTVETQQIENKTKEEPISEVVIDSKVEPKKITTKTKVEKKPTQAKKIEVVAKTTEIKKPVEAKKEISTTEAKPKPQEPIDVPKINTLDDLKKFLGDLSLEYSMDLDNLQKWCIIARRSDIKKYQHKLVAVGFRNYEHRGCAYNVNHLVAKLSSANNDILIAEDDGMAFQ